MQKFNAMEQKLMLLTLCFLIYPALIEISQPSLSSQQIQRVSQAFFCIFGLLLTLSKLTQNDIKISYLRLKHLLWSLIICQNCRLVILHSCSKPNCGITFKIVLEFKISRQIDLKQQNLTKLVKLLISNSQCRTINISSTWSKFLKYQLKFKIWNTSTTNNSNTTIS